ncbi:Heterokaryon incompatibility protein (HET) domain containing protein [Rhypophila decipiens]
MSTYQYKPLPVNHIRLVQLLPNGDDNAPLRCQLLDYPILSGKIGCHLYDALSYIWGPPPNTREIEVLDASDCWILSIRENCHAALVRLRDPVLPRFIWVDSICINQDDNKEKTHQVQMMTKIYALASRVVVWLREPGHGNSPSGVSRALELIRRGADHHSGDIVMVRSDRPFKLAARDAADMSLLLQRSWFRRIWVLQEISAAREVVMIEGPQEINGFTFASGLELLKLDASESPKEHLDAIRRTQMAATLIQRALSRSRMLSPKDLSSDQFTLGVDTLSALIDMFHDHDATDRRDKLFALLGMGSDVPSTLRANYDQSWGQVLHELVTWIFAGDEPNHTRIKTWDDHEIAIMKTKMRVLGRVIKVKPRTPNGIRVVLVEWRLDRGSLCCYG